MTRLVLCHVFHRMTRLESQSMTPDSALESESFLQNLSVPDGQTQFVCTRNNHYPGFRLDIRQDNEFATGYGYPKTAFKWEPDANPGIRNVLSPNLKALVFLYAFEESVDCHLLSSFCDDSNLHISLFKHVLSMMGVSKESISKFLIGNRCHVKLRILSPYSNRI